MREDLILIPAAKTVCAFYPMTHIKLMNNLPLPVDYTDNWASEPDSYSLLLFPKNLEFYSGTRRVQNATPHHQFSEPGD